jgi:cobalamin biosynthetic protein CobC
MAADDGFALHGGAGADFLAAHYPFAPTPWLDLSTGINPWPYDHCASRAASETLPATSLYQACRLSAAAYFGAPADAVALMPGSQAAISLLPRLFRPAVVAVREPSYGEHARSWREAGHTVQMTDAIFPAQPEILVVINPNNPDGRLIDRKSLIAEADRRARQGQWLIVDEAFGDLLPEETLQGAYGTPNLIVFRSFGKFFGLAGIRLGFAVAPPQIAHDLEAMIGPWAVSGPALEAGARAYRDTDWQLRTRVRLASAAARQRYLFEQAGLELLGGASLFTLVEHARAAGLFAHLCGHGIHVRRFAERREWLRFGLVPDDASFTRLQTALLSWSRP